MVGEKTPKIDVSCYVFDFKRNNYEKVTIHNVVINKGDHKEVQKISRNDIIFRMVLHDLFPDYIIYDYQLKKRTPNGFPDFILIKRTTGEELFIEIKTKDDSVRFNQLNWFFENKDVERKLVWITHERQCFEEFVKKFIGDGSDKLEDIE